MLMMNKIVRRDSDKLEDLPNVGACVAEDLRRLGIHTARALRGRDPYALYHRLNRTTGVRHDPCVLDTFIAVVDFVGGAPARPWWSYTEQRKRVLADRGEDGNRDGS
jgi:hypothetical protein